MMYGPEKSDLGVVAMKLANKPWMGAESMERRLVASRHPAFGDTGASLHGGGQGERAGGVHVPDTEPGKRAAITPTRAAKSKAGKAGAIYIPVASHHP